MDQKRKKSLGRAYLVREGPDAHVGANGCRWDLEKTQAQFQQALQLMVCHEL